MSEFAIQTTDLTKRFGTFTAVDTVSLQVRRGEIFGFLGPNGAGKTTTIKLLLDMIRPSQGTVAVLGLDPRYKSVEVHKQIGFLAGDMELYDNLTGAQYFDFISSLKGGVDPRRINELVERLDASPHKRIGSLSRGNQQKIGLVAALMHDPELLILDEPTTGLDPLIQEQFYELMQAHRAAGKTVFISSHILSEVQHLCDRVGFMKKGKLIETIDVASLLHQARKIVQVDFESPQPDLALPDFPDLEVIDKTPERLAFRCGDSSKWLVMWLSELPVRDVTIQNADLDDIFLRLYGKEGE